MKAMCYVVGLLLLLFSGNPLLGYERPVHVTMSGKAFDRVAVDFQKKLGVSRDHRVNGEFLRVWVGRGAHAEDFVPTARSLHHFFDPAPRHEVGLTIPGVNGCRTVGERADRWAVAPQGFNGFGLQSAQLAYWNTVTGHNPGYRDVWVKELFYDLGHIIHLVQDMAQPEHTRNDQHLTFTHILFGNATAPSLYEDWGGRNLVEDRTKKPVVSLDGYPTVKLADYASYFHTPDSRGLADFANRNFVTQDTNYSDGPFNPCEPARSRTPHCFYYDFPKIDDAFARNVVKEERVFNVADDEWQDLRVRHRVFTSFPHDNYLNKQERDEHHTYYSALDIETRRYGCNVYSLAEDSYRSRASLLIPRAVGYSAGLIEHFFRGSIDAEWIPKRAGVCDLKITNRSAEAIGADAMIHVAFRATPAYFGHTDSTDTSFITGGLLTDLIPGFSGIQPNQTVTLTDLPARGLKSGDSIINFERRIAIRGTLGGQRGEVIGSVQVPGTAPKNRVDFDGYVPPGTSTNFLWTANIAGGTAWGVEGGSVTFLHPAFRASSAVYSTLLTHHADGSQRLTFWWGAQVKTPKFRLINDQNPKSFLIRLSDNRFVDGGQILEVSLGAFEEVLVNLPESGIARFTVIRNGWGVFAIDDVSWGP